MLSERGARLLVLDGFKFRRQCDIGIKTRWWCSTHYNRGCRAVVYTIGPEAIHWKNMHNHPPARLEQSARGAPIITIGGYRFSQHKRIGEKTRWFCGSHHSKRCKAVIYTIEDEIVKCNNTHNHPPTRRDSFFTSYEVMRRREVPTPPSQ
ncbi:unnamed protein product, partial [Iphiclides podalirius]